MALNLESLKAKLLALAKENRIDFQVMLDRFVVEQFLARLSSSREKEHLIFKGGSLLVYIIETNRKTRDIDFSVVGLSDTMEAMLDAVKNVLEVRLDDGITWGKVDGDALEHPALEENGLRVTCIYHVGKMKGKLQIDLARGDRIEPVPTLIHRMRYKKLPLAGADFSIPAYPPEFIFAEKLFIAVTRGAANSRMKDYYDLLQLSKALDHTKKLDMATKATFKNRGSALEPKLDFSSEVIEVMESSWSRFVSKERLGDAPRTFAEVVERLKQFLLS